MNKQGYKEEVNWDLHLSERNKHWGDKTMSTSFYIEKGKGQKQADNHQLSTAHDNKNEKI